MITHYTAIVAITSFAMLTMLAAAQCNIFLRQSKRIRFQLLFISLLLANVLEYISATVMGDASHRILFIVTKTAELTISPVIPFLAAAAIGSKKGFRELNQKLSDKKVKLYWDFDLVRFSGGSSGFSYYNDSARICFWW